MSKIILTHWTRRSGEGHIIGEACHVTDLLRFLSGAPIVSHGIQSMSVPTGDTATINLGFTNGSMGTVHYFANGSKAFPKERLEVFSGGRILQLDNFRKLKGYGWPGFSKLNLPRQDKGQKACAQAFVSALENGAPAPIVFEEIVEITAVTIHLARNAKL
jgi:predicted dehydrogenase